MQNRRSFLRNSLAISAAATAYPLLSASNKKAGTPAVDWLRNDEKAQRIAFFEPARGAVRNPGMGISAFVHSDHMEPNQGSNELLKLDKPTFDRFAALPYNDNLYMRYEWRDVQKDRSKLSLPDGWKWTLEAVEKLGKRWSFRIMNFMPQSTSRNGLPEFLQGKLKMIPYWHREITYGQEPYFHPEYSEDYLKYWDELNYLLGEAFDDHPLLDFVDVSGFGLWGEGHHYYAEEDNGRQWNHPQGSPDRLEYINNRIIEGHLKAFPKTPGALNVHIAEFECGLKAFQEGRVWARRDSFQEVIRTQEIAIAQGLQPGTGGVWEQMSLRPDNTASFPNDEEFDSDEPFLLPGRYFDIGAHFVGIGFSPWVNMWAHENCSKTLEYIAQNIGYRIRPAIIWKRQLRGREELVLGLRNDGSSAPPGTIRITADFSGHASEQIELPVGEPVPGKMQMYAIPMPGSMWTNQGEVSLSMQIMMKGKIADVQWAARKKSPQQDNNRLVVSI
jgi:hypothetical protein